MFEEIVKVYNNDTPTERGNLGGFESVEIPNPEEFVQQHDRIISNPDFFVGSGNNAVVYDASKQTEEFRTNTCVKALWRKVSAEASEKRYKELPEVAKPLRKIQDYFEIIKEKKRKLINKGHEFRPQVSPETEARYSNRAHLILKDAGSDVSIPWINRLIELKRGEDNYETDPKYSWEEDVTLLVMEKVHGENIEKIILGMDEDALVPKISFEEFSKKLRDAVELFHKKGLYHNDISTRNIMVREDGEPVIIDFGGGFQGFEGQVNEQMYKQNLEDLEKTLKWLGKYIDNPEKTSDELRDYLDKMEE
jgi:serine/threonine protein kinase